MELKKNPKHNLRNRYPMHLAMGFIISIGLVITAFEWTTYGPSKFALDDYPDDSDVITPDVLLPAIYSAEKPPAKPKKPALLPILIPTEIEQSIKRPETPGADQVEPDQVLVIPEIPPEAPEIYNTASVDQQAEPKDGWKGFAKFLKKNLKYPWPAQRARVEGKVYISFVVQIDGSISEVTVVKGIGFGCDEAALQVVSKLPQWTPAKRAGIRVPVRMMLPIQFKLN